MASIMWRRSDSLHMPFSRMSDLTHVTKSGVQAWVSETITHRLTWPKFLSHLIRLKREQNILLKIITPNQNKWNRSEWQSREISFFNFKIFYHKFRKNWGRNFCSRSICKTFFCSLKTKYFLTGWNATIFSILAWVVYFEKFRPEIFLAKIHI